MGRIARFLGLEQKAIDNSHALATLIRESAHEIAAGINVSPSTALDSPTASNAISYLSRMLSHIPLVLIDKSSEGRERATYHPLYKLVHQKPNAWQTPIEFRSDLWRDYFVYGHAYALKNVVNGEIRELTYLPASQVTIRKNMVGEPLFDWQPEQGAARTFTWRELFHLSAEQGIAPITRVRQSIGQEIALERFSGAFFKNGIRPSGYLKSENNLTDEQFEALKKNITDQYGGAGNAAKPMVLEGGLSWEALSMSAEDAQVLESRAHVRTQIAAGFGVPVHKLGGMENATFSNIEHQALEVVIDTIVPLCSRWEQAVTRDLIPATEQDSIVAEHIVQGLMRGDNKSRADFYQRGTQAGWLTRNEARKLENLPPLDGLDEPLTPLNMTTGNPSGDDDGSS
jgi:HK97 family phage portal protein